MKFKKRLAMLVLLGVGVVTALPAQQTASISASDLTKTATKLPGYFPLYWDAKSGKLWLEVTREKWDKEFLFLDSLPAGVGSNDIGLDRGQLGEGRVVKFERIGPKVFLVQVNYGFRASSANAAERRSVQDAFAQSVLAGFTVAAEEGDTVLVDATEFFTADAHGVAEALHRAGQGKYRLDLSRSAIYLPATKNFPQNTEVESTLTFAAEDPERAGDYVRAVVPSSASITVREHYSLIQLPEAGFQPRKSDPRGGFFGVSYLDFASPIGDPLTKQFIARHRLQKKDPTAAVSEVVKPIVYYVDPGAPEPIRSALKEGASWWAQAFEAAGFKNAFIVKDLPVDADPMDVRYNVIQWVHRQTRGWSYGVAITDPRTGEIIKGHVTLGSQRVRQDYMIFEALLSPHSKGKPVDPRMLEAALARLRQLAAHEVGHTLGLQHNYLASSFNRGSVMDYPHPLVKIAADGSLDLSDAYAVGIGSWDKVTIDWGYSEVLAGKDEHAVLNAILQEAQAKGISFLTDQDGRPTSSSHPQTHLWDNGANAVDELDRVMQVRKVALDHFSEQAIREGDPMAWLEDRLVPVYLFHRYQVEAAVKTIGGQSYSYALRNDGQTPTGPVPATEQRRALNSVLRTIAPEALAIPDRIVALIPPHPTGWERTRESFPSHAGLNFDPLAAAEVAARHTVRLLLNPERCERLMEHNSRDASALQLGEMLDALVRATWGETVKPATSAGGPPTPGPLDAVGRVVDGVVMQEMMALAQNPDATVQVRAVASAKLNELRTSLEAVQTLPGIGSLSNPDRALVQYAANEIHRAENAPAGTPKATEPAAIPPGMPIGAPLGATEEDDWGEAEIQ